MLKWFFNLFSIRERTEQDDLLEYIQQGECPDCQSTEFYVGPSGGFCQNFTCANEECGSSFNVGIAFGRGVIMVERIKGK